jgi:hypothetical protein
MGKFDGALKLNIGSGVLLTKFTEAKGFTEDSVSPAAISPAGRFLAFNILRVAITDADARSFGGPDSDPRPL